MVFSVFTYEAANEYGSLEQFNMDPATATVMDIMSKVRESTKLQNSNVKVGMRLYAYVDYVPGDLINDTEKDPLVLSATLDELRRSERVQFEEDRRGLHLKVLVDGCRTAEEAAELTLRQSWRTEYAVATLMRDVDILKKERDVAVRLAAAAMRVAEDTETDTNNESGDNNVDARRAEIRNAEVPFSSFARLVTNLTMRAVDEGDLNALRVLHSRLLCQSPSSQSNDSEQHTHDDTHKAMHRKTYTRIVDNNGRSLLHRAAKCGHMYVVRALVKEFGMDVNEKNKDGNTLLHLASENGQIDTVRVVVSDFGTDVNEKNKEGNTPLHLASSNGHMATVRALVKEFGMNVKEKNNDHCTPLHLAFMNGHMPALIALEKLGINVNEENNDCNTLLHLASENGHIDTVRVLVSDFGMDVNEKNKEGNTPLHLASLNGHMDVMRALVVEFDADANEKNKDGNTPLHLASSNGHMAAVRALVKKFCADVKERNNNGNTPLHLASVYGHVDVVRALVKKFGINVKVRNKNGNTPLHLASSNGQMHVMRALVGEFGADVNERNDAGKTPLGLTFYSFCSGRQLATRQLLQELGASHW